MKRRITTLGSLVGLMALGASTAHGDAARSLLGLGPSPFARFNNGGGEGGGEGGGGTQRTLADAERELGEAKARLTTLQTERDGLDAKVKGFEDKDKTESDKLQTKITDAEKQRDAALALAKEAALRIEVERQARRLNIVDEDAAYQLLDKGAVVFDSAGKATNVETLLKALIAARPYLAGEQKPGGGGNPGNPPRNRGGNTMPATPGYGRLRNAYDNK